MNGFLVSSGKYVDVVDMIPPRPPARPQTAPVFGDPTCAFAIPTGLPASAIAFDSQRQPLPLPYGRARVGIEVYPSQYLVNPSLLEGWHLPIETPLRRNVNPPREQVAFVGLANLPDDNPVMPWFAAMPDVIRRPAAPTKYMDSWQVGPAISIPGGLLPPPWLTQAQTPVRVPGRVQAPQYDIPALFSWQWGPEAYQLGWFVAPQTPIPPLRPKMEPAPAISPLPIAIGPEASIYFAAATQPMAQPTPRRLTQPTPVEFSPPPPWYACCTIVVNGPFWVVAGQVSQAGGAWQGDVVSES